ncbi:MAG TPA: Co2+/Mg2+ efflux protein ApaG [Gemmatimonadales bacterium]|nr:Co2+/Mg2+ efflux protein ApaG [Gemmatimonadales bacterium]
MSKSFYYRLTNGIRITVRPQFLPDRSRPAAGEFVFVYQVRIENVSGRTVQLLRRRWLIHDAVGEDQVVEGDGVVGQQPVLEAGEVHEYQSFCVLRSQAGHMEGQYFFEAEDGTLFAADIPRFELDAGAGAGPMY